jgi:hypothetical protein
MNKKKLQQAIKSQRKAKSKITWGRQVSDPLGKGNGSTHPRQNHAQTKRTNHQNIQELPLHICMLPLNKCQPWPQTGQAGSQNRSGRFHQNQSGRLPKSVRPIWYNRLHPPKAKNAKEMHKLPLDYCDRFQGCNATFLHLSFSPFLPMHESRLKFEIMQPRDSQVYKMHHKMLHISKWANLILYSFVMTLTSWLPSFTTIGLS